MVTLVSGKEPKDYAHVHGTQMTEISLILCFWEVFLGPVGEHYSLKPTTTTLK